ncbi:putative odorant-binding protein A10 [Wyeomyia smithii]|uniref:putative odorant-binding protein A10 n=1 Tax=Wyeomyia smithii TaxID=174621 RepID=UPI002467BBB0|nr:putative odorant-binding protein A10 [Wyeomyia smithii]
MRSAKLTMQSTLGIIVVFAVLLSRTVPAVEANDSQNLNRLLNNQVIVSRQIMCVLEKSPCDQLGRQLKAALPEVIQRNCRNCSPQQAQNAQKLTNFLQTRYPEVWAMLIRKYGAV